MAVWSPNLTQTWFDLLRVSLKLFLPYFTSPLEQKLALNLKNKGFKTILNISAFEKYAWDVLISEYIYTLQVCNKTWKIKKSVKLIHNIKISFVFCINFIFEK